jgi:glycosyltransferase involved in cell wall biosynthesis
MNRELNISPYKISIIIPVYNAEQTIDRCLDSVCGQTYTNLEIILVNDGSSDHSLEKLERWKQQDNRIIVISQDNSGSAIARNKGLYVATGDYIGFVDADDFVERDF